MGTESAVRVLAVLRALAAAPTPQRAQTLSRTLGIPRASLYRLLRAMCDEGFVTQFPEERRWGSGSRRSSWDRPTCGRIRRPAWPVNNGTSSGARSAAYPPFGA